MYSIYDIVYGEVLSDMLNGKSHRVQRNIIRLLSPCSKKKDRGGIRTKYNGLVKKKTTEHKQIVGAMTECAKKNESLARLLNICSMFGGMGY